MDTIVISIVEIMNQLKLDHHDKPGSTGRPFRLIVGLLSCAHSRRLTEENGGRWRDSVDWLKIDINIVGCRQSQRSRGQALTCETDRSWVRISRGVIVDAHC